MARARWCVTSLNGLCFSVLFHSGATRRHGGLGTRVAGSLRTGLSINFSGGGLINSVGALLRDRGFGVGIMISGTDAARTIHTTLRTTKLGAGFATDSLHTTGTTTVRAGTRTSTTTTHRLTQRETTHTTGTRLSLTGTHRESTGTTEQRVATALGVGKTVGDRLDVIKRLEGFIPRG